MQNLLSKNIDKVINLADLPLKDAFQYLYWKDAGLNRKTGEKTLTLQRFEEKYQDELISLAKEVKNNTLEDKMLSLENPQLSLIKRLKEFDYLYNVKWPQVHLKTASHYLDKKGENKAATGGSEWKKYLNPKHQQRCFFPTLWKEKEIYHWNI